jgi:hypothetical protein
MVPDEKHPYGRGVQQNHQVLETLTPVARPVRDWPVRSVFAYDAFKT